MLGVGVGSVRVDSVRVVVGNGRVSNAIHASAKRGIEIRKYNTKELKQRIPNSRIVKLQEESIERSARDIFIVKEVEGNNILELTNTNKHKHRRFRRSRVSSR